MKPLAPYLFFDGTCHEAMTFYQSCFGGELDIRRFSEAPEGSLSHDPIPQDQHDKVMHAALVSGDLTVMASDWPGITVGTHVSLYVPCDSKSEVDRLYAQLSAGAPQREDSKPTEVFWGAYFAILTDRFGVSWMLSFETV